MRIIKILTLAMLLAVVSGCSSKQATTTVCKASSEYGDTTETIEASGDEVTKYTISMIQDLSEYADISIYTDEELEATYKSDYGGIYDDLNGVEYMVAVENGILTRTLVVDYSKADIKELTEGGLIQGSNSDTVDYISLEKTIEAAKKINAKCEEE